MSIAADNRDAFNKLAEAARQRQLAILVGAGASIACGYPGWPAFVGTLEREVEEIVLPARLEDLRRQDVRTRVDRIASYLGDSYARIFEETFQPKVPPVDPPEWVRLIHDLQPRLLLTTNYTSELEEAARFTPIQPIKWYDGDAVDRALKRADGRARLLYLHGRYDDPVRLEPTPDGHEWCRVVLGEKSYRYAYEYPGIVRQRLLAVWQTHTLLVIGASLRDEDLMRTLRSVKALSPRETHFAALELGADDRARAVAEDCRERFGIQPIFYRAASGDHGGPLTAFLSELITQANHGATRSPHASSARSMPTVRVVGEYPPRPRIVHPLLRAAVFEPRPLYRIGIDEFLRDEAGGVLALIGMGGAGKTALVREAIEPLLRPDGAGPTFDGLFVWSFYDSPSSVLFFCDLLDYVTGKRPTEDTKEIRAYDAVRRAISGDERLLIVLDGLERLQTEQRQPGRIDGSLESPAMRQFLLWLAQTNVPSRALITTRFPLPELAPEARGERVRLLDVDNLTRPQARSLLRHRGVRGSDAEIDAVFEYFGTHALTVDQLGGVITNYLGGDATRFRELTDGTQPLTRFAVGQTTAKLAHVIAAYEGYLERSEPEVGETLQRVAIFPQPPSVEMLTASAGSQSGRTELALRDQLRRLVNLRFLSAEVHEGQEVWVIHPAIRETVLLRLGSRRQDLAGMARLALELSLERRPRFDFRDKETLSQVENLIILSIDEGRLLQAVELYRERLGGYPILGWLWAEYARGERICRRLLDAGRAAQSLSVVDDYVLCADLALNLENLGRLQEALVYFRQTLEFERARAAQPKLHVRLHNVAQACFLAGELREASVVADRTFEMATQIGDQEEALDGHSWRALIALERGQIVEAVEQFAKCRAVQNSIQKDKRILYSTRGFGFQRALLACGRPTEALAQADASREIHESQGWQDSIARSQLAAAEALRQLHDRDAARARLAEVRDWASRANHHELLLGTRLCASRVSLDEGDLASARDEAENGMRLADMSGFGLFSIDFRNVLALSSITEGGDEARAVDVATTALDMAKRIRCDYFWGQLAAHRVLAAALERLGRTNAAFAHNRSVTELEANIELSDELLAPLL